MSIFFHAPFKASLITSEAGCAMVGIASAITGASCACEQLVLARAAKDKDKAINFLMILIYSFTVF